MKVMGLLKGNSVLLNLRRILVVDRGMSFIEVIVSVAILGIMAIPFANMFISSITSNYTAQKEMEAYAIANQFMEAAKANDVLTEGSSSMDVGTKYRVDVVVESPVTLATQDVPESIDDVDITMDFTEGNSLKTGGHSETLSGNIDKEIHAHSSDIEYEIDAVKYSATRQSHNVLIKAPSAFDENIDSITLNFYNYSDQLLTIYKENDVSQKIKIKAMTGAVKVWDNLVSSQAKTKTLKITVTVIDLNAGRSLVQLISDKLQY